ncbi:MAG: hypothetical protein WC683_02695 [bacterium]
MLEKLARIRVLFRQADTLSLWGIPYAMRPGQQPADIMTEHRGEWLWLGCPGWWYTYTVQEQGQIEAFLKACGDAVPENPNEWCELSHCG